MKTNYNQQPIRVIKPQGREIAIFEIEGQNIDQDVVKSFGEEWNKFHAFQEQDLQTGGNEYFDIVSDAMLHKNSIVLDIGCGSGRWTKFLSPRAGFIEAIDPSLPAILAAERLLGDDENVRLSVASVDNIPFADGTFDFAMSIGVLHHLPDTQRALIDCVKKVKVGGYFYVYLYYNLDNRGIPFRVIFKLVSLVRMIISRLPAGLKKFICDLIAICVYMPLVLTGRCMNALGMKNIARRLPLAYYQNKSFFVIRNDALDRFGTSLEHRFSRIQVETMMKAAGLEDITISTGTPFYHAVGKKKR